MSTISKIKCSLTPHVTGIAMAMELALDYAADRHPEFADEVSIAGAEVDGQFVKVKVWVSNQSEETFVFDASNPESVQDA